MWILAAAGAWAQEPTLVGETFNYDPVLIAAVQAEDRAWDPDAAMLFERLVERFRRTNTVLDMADVPDFDDQGYDAGTYVKSCPPGQYPGCALVVGQRAQADRAIGATVRREPDELDDTRTVLVATFHVVDVLGSREIVSFTVPIAEGELERVVEGLSTLYDDIVRGEYELEDLRERPDTDQAALDRAREQQMVQALDKLEERLGAAVVTQRDVEVQAPKVTIEDLAQYAARDDTAPWDRLGMSQREYVRFANSGETVEGWRWSGWGRTGRLLVRVGGGVGPGPWDQRYASQVLVSGTTLQPLDSAQLLEVTQSSTAVGDFELGVGILPWLEASFAAAVHAGRLEIASDEDVDGQVPLTTDPVSSGASTWQFGGRVAAAPFPRWVARPVLGAGLAAWKGSGTAASDRFEALAAPTATYLELLPGVEVSASDDVVPWLRLNTSIPLGGTLLREQPSAGVMTNPPVAVGDPGVGFAVELGLQVRIGPFVRPKPVRP